jgi:hypothetical protein
VIAAVQAPAARCSSSGASLPAATTVEHHWSSSPVTLASLLAVAKYAIHREPDLSGSRPRCVRHWTLVIAAAVVVAGCSSSADSPDAAERASGSPSPSASATGTPSLAPTSSRQPAPNSPVPSASAPNPTFSTVTVVRSGGFAGVRDQYTLTPTGALTAQTNSGATIRRQLSPAALAQLRALATGRQFAGEARRGPIRPPSCADGFNYTVSAGSLRVSGADCGNLAQESPAMWKIIQLVEGAANAG